MQGYLWDWLVAGAAILINLLVPANAVKPVTRYFNENVSTQSPFGSERMDDMKAHSGIPSS